MSTVVSAQIDDSASGVNIFLPLQLEQNTIKQKHVMLFTVSLVNVLLQVFNNVYA